MTTRQWRSGGRGGSGNARLGREWIGGRVSPPFFIEHLSEPYRAELVIWMELPSGLVVGQQLLRPEEAQGATARVLRAAMKRPAAGPPRRPDRIRVRDASLADEVRAAIGDAVPIEIAPTPELDGFVGLLVESMPRGDVDESYLERGRIAPETVKSLFAAAEVLYRIAPWKFVTDDQVLRMDIPALGVERACLCIIGALGQSRGVLVFPSLGDYQAFRHAAERRDPLRIRVEALRAAVRRHLAGAAVLDTVVGVRIHGTGRDHARLVPRGARKGAVARGS
jgi:hypothetical protein